MISSHPPATSKEIGKKEQHFVALTIDKGINLVFLFVFRTLMLEQRIDFCYPP